MPTSGDRAATNPAAINALRAILDAVDIPYAANDRDEKRRQILDMRLREVVSALRCIDMSGYDPDSIAWQINYLRERLAKIPATGYLTEGEALAAAVEAR